jgi:hypothetical protein
MGLLDDAIREHLDLKRRRGSDPTEVARLEQEALGPVRREPEPAADAGEHPRDEQAAHHGEAPATHEVDERPEPEHLAHEPAHHEEHEHHAHEPDAAAHEAPDPRHSDIVHQPTTEFRVEDHHDDEHDEPGVQPPADGDEKPAPRDEHMSWADDLEHDEPAAPDRGEAPPASDEDVLEETPEFLQETPEHDRLWFEQRPPRDFDFDG